MNVRRFIGKCKAATYIITGKVYPSFSQGGEDQIIRYLLNALKISFPTYLDIGANHPIIANNTYLFYSRGGKGVCIEPDEDFYKLLQKARPRDIVLNVGIGVNDLKSADLYVFPAPYTGWNTFSEPEAQQRETETGIKIKSVRKVEMVNINKILEKFFSPHPNIFSIDVEGLDLDILKSMDFSKYRPEIICAESITFSMSNKEEKISEIADLLTSKGYFVFGDTHINTIFCNADSYRLISST
jgi:FkbM family methyltransferase